ncbi:MAG: SCP2 sterol-binding domain-containing protein [Candidatus Thermoplasmatota archaeon]|nr:SCP2 sterol-binding domain-containing protein [Candidatus Thermoplasmatota archaeon]
MIGKLEGDDRFRVKLSKVNRSFSVEFDGKEFYNFSIENGVVSEISAGKIDADISISVPSKVFRQILSREVNPMTAYFEKKLRIRASLGDKLLMTEIFR